MVICLWSVHALGVLPGVISEQAHARQDDQLDVEHRRCEQLWYETGVLGRDVKFGCDIGIDGNEDNPKRHASRDRNHVVLGPVVRNKTSLSEHRGKHSSIKSCTPDPMASRRAVVEDIVAIVEQLATNIQNERVVERIDDPVCKNPDLEELVLLSNRVELRITVEESRRDELVQDTDDQGWENSVENVVKGQRPRLVNDLSGEYVLECVLGLLAVNHRKANARDSQLTQNWVMYRVMFL